MVAWGQRAAVAAVQHNCFDEQGGASICQVARYCTVVGTVQYHTVGADKMLG
jgi:hypothetical protein